MSPTTNQTNTPQQAEEALDQLDEQVGEDAEASFPEESEGQEETLQDDQAEDQDEDASAEQQAGEAESGQEQPGDERFVQLESQMGQMAEAVNRLTNLVQQTAHQQRPQGPQPPPTRSAQDLENMSQPELAQYTLQQVAGRQAQALTRFDQVQTARFAVFAEALGVLLEDNPRYKLVTKAFEIMNQAPNHDKSFKSAYAEARNAVVEKENVHLQRQRQKDLKANRHRAFKAKRGQPPRGVTPPARPPIARTNYEAVDQAIAMLDRE